jgi:hypothetical protein
MRRGDPLEAVLFADTCLGIRSYPESSMLETTILEAIESMKACPEVLRPRSRKGQPGALLEVSTPASIIVPDLHGRIDFLKALLCSEFPEESISRKGKTIARLLSEGELSIICLGDVLHSEGLEAAQTWKHISLLLAETPGPEGLLTEEMDEEMGRSLKTLMLVAGLMTRFPGTFFCLKGNHDNMGNKSSEGDLPFYKYAYEGIMGSEWFRARYGERLLEMIRDYELLLPLVAKGRGFFASHAEPLKPIDSASLREYRSRPDVVRSLIWTENGEAFDGSVEQTMRSLSKDGDSIKTTLWFAGHRHVQNGFKLRASDGFAQIHDPNRNQVVIADDGSEHRRPGSMEKRTRSILYEIDMQNASMKFIASISPRS